MDKWIEKRPLKIVAGAILIGAAAVTLINASGADVLFKPENYEHFTRQDHTEDFDYTAGSGEDINLADKDKDSHETAQEKEKQQLALAEELLQDSDSGLLKENSSDSLRQADGTETDNATDHRNGFEFVDTDKPGILPTRPGNGSGINGGQNGTGNGEKPSNDNSDNHGKDPDHGNGGDKKDDDPKKPNVWEDEQLKPKDPEETEYGRLTALTAKINRAYYSVGDEFQGTDATVTATFLEADGTSAKRELHYGGRDGYKVTMSTNKRGMQIAIFSYGGLSARANYKVLESTLNVGFFAEFNGEYYQSSYPGIPLRDLLGQEIYQKIWENNRKHNYSTTGDVFDLSDTFRAMIAYLGNQNVKEAFAEVKEDSCNCVVFLEEQDGYLTNMLQGFRNFYNRELVDACSYVYYPGGDWVTPKNIINFVVDVEEGYKIRRVTESDADSPDYRADQVLEAYTREDSVLSVPMGVTKIDLKQISESVTTLEIPESVQSVNWKSIAECLPNLQEYNYAGGRDYHVYGKYKIQDGVVYSADGRTLLSVPCKKKKVNVPAEVMTLAENCFEGSTSETEIHFEGMTPPEIQKKTGGRGTVIMPVSEMDTVWKQYQLAFKEEGEKMIFGCEDGRRDLYRYGNENTLRYKDRREVLAAVDADIQGEYVIPEDVTGIGEGAFSGCKKLAGLKVGGQVTRLESGALILPESVETVRLQGKRTEVSGTVFGDPQKGYQVPDLKIYAETGYQSYIEQWKKVLDPVYGMRMAEKLLQEDEKGYLYEDGVVYQKQEKDGKAVYSLLSVYDTGLTALKVKPGTVSIKADALKECDTLEILYLPESLEEIEDEALTNCTALKTVVSEKSGLFKEKDYGIPADASVFTKGEGWKSFEYEGTCIYGVLADGKKELLKVSSDQKGTLKIQENTEKLHEKALENCRFLEKILFLDENSLKEIGERCFKDCKMLTTLSIPKGVTDIPEGMCEGCTELKEVEVSDLRSVGDRAFYECRSLDTVPGTDTLTAIGTAAFYGCQSLKSFVLPENISSVGEGAFENCTGITFVEINAGLKGIGRYSFYGCSNLMTVTFGEKAQDTMKVLGVQAFGQCSKLEAIDLTGLKELEQMGERTFEGCEGLTTVKFPAKLKKIPDYCFEYCRSLSIVQLNSEAVPELGIRAFGEEIPVFLHIWVDREMVNIYQKQYKGVMDEVYGSGTAENVISERNENQEIIKGVLFEMTKEGMILKKASENYEGDFMVPEGTVRIEADAFAGCNGLVSMILPEDSSISLGDRCFKGCQGLERIELRGSIPEWGDETFMDCTSLKSVDIGSEGTTSRRSDGSYSIERIGTRAFKNCTGLTEAGCVSVRTVNRVWGKECFAGCSNLATLAILNEARGKLEVIEDSAFEGCTGMTALLTSKYSGLKVIGKYAFRNCDTLKAPSIPASVTAVGEGCFMDCDNIQYVSFYGALEEYPKDCFKNCPKLLKTGGTAAAFSGLKRIGEGAYEGCVSLTSTQELNWGLYKYTNLEEIGANAFQGCISLPDSELPATVKKIGKGAFDGCTSIRILTLGAELPPQMDGFTLASMAVDFGIRVPDSEAEEDRIYKAYYESLLQILDETEVRQILDSVSDGAKGRNTQTEEISLQEQRIETGKGEEP